MTVCTGSHRNTHYSCFNYDREACLNTSQMVQPTFYRNSHHISVLVFINQLSGHLAPKLHQYIENINSQINRRARSDRLTDCTHDILYLIHCCVCGSEKSGN